MKTFLLILFSFTNRLCFSQSDSTVIVYFNHNQSTTKLPSNFLATFDTLKWNPSIILISSADTVGDSNYNKWLSEKRALFVKQKIEMNTFFRVSTIHSNGEQRLSKELADNRCVVIIFSAKNKKSIPLTKLFDPTDTNIVVGQRMILTNIKFELNTATLLGESYREVDKLALFMKQHPTLVIRITGHVCCAPAELLSTNRAKKVVDLLIKKGISAERLSYKGYSNTRLSDLSKDPNSDEQRRVEIEIVSY